MARRVVTAETAEGRRAIQEVMDASYQADLDRVPPAWARALLVDDVPVSFILVDPDDPLPFPRGPMRTAFVTDTATRKDRRRQGHFRALWEATFADLRTAGLPAVTTHGEARLYRQFGFGVFAPHAALFCTPDLVAQRLGKGVAQGGAPHMEIEGRRGVRPDLLVVKEVAAKTIPEARALLQAAAALARERGKARLMLAWPGSLFPGTACPYLQDPLTAMVLACGGRLVLSGADPEGRKCEHADWIKVLDSLSFLREAVRLSGIAPGRVPPGQVQFATEAGSAGVRVSATGLEVLERIPGAPVITWPSTALAQLVLGYSTAEVLAEISSTPLAPDVVEFLDALFPQQWRLSENDDWIFTR